MGSRAGQSSWSCGGLDHRRRAFAGGGRRLAYSGAGVVWLFFLAAVGAGPSRVAVRGDDTCPSPGEVSRQLEVLLAGAARQRPRYDAYVLAVPDRVHIDLVSGDGVRLAERDLPRRGSCA